jgi:transposase
MLYIALELSNKKWKIGFSDGGKFRIKTIEGGDLNAFDAEVAKTLQKWNLDRDTVACSVYEAGRDGFWIHRFLVSKGVESIVVDPASIEVNRRKRRAKTDRLDVKSLLRQLIRYRCGEKKVWSVVKIPSIQAEDERRREREIKRIKTEMVAGRSRIKGLLALHGIKLRGWAKFLSRLESCTQYNGEKLPTCLQEELRREYERVEFARGQLAALEKQRLQRLKAPESRAELAAGRLLSLKGVGPVSSMTLGEEFFGWREFKNVREVGACAGLTGTAYDSGQSRIEQGISKAGNAKVRTLMIELAWSWLRFQPQSALARWYQERFASGGVRLRRIGIVALARKLLVALWKYVDKGELPEGAILKAV